MIIPKMFFRLVQLLFAGTMLSSCYTLHETVSVKVVDKITQLPIDSVHVKFTDGNKCGGDHNCNPIEGYTNSNGEFKGILRQTISFNQKASIYSEYDKKGYIIKKEIDKPTGFIELEK